MTETLSTPEQHIAALNDQLRKDESFKEGMAFLPYPAGAKGMDITGYSVTGSFHLLGVYARAAHEVAKRFKF